MKRRFLWFVSCLIAVSESYPLCDDFFVRRPYGHKFSILLPKTTQTAIRIKVELRFQFQLKSEGNLPDIEFHERGLSKIWEDIDRGNPIDFKVILRNNRKNDPEIHRVLLDKEIMCENHEVIRSSYVFKRVLTKVLNLPPRQPKIGSFEDGKVDSSEESDIDRSIEVQKNHEKCGNSTLAKAYTPNANETFVETFPWIAAMYIQDLYVCPATFISNTRAVTAAHCLKGRINVKKIILYIFAGTRYVSVNDHKSHPHYRIGAQKYDIAILETNRVNDPRFIPVCLTNDPSTLLGNRGKIFSYVFNYKTISYEQRTKDLPVVHDKYCDDIVSGHTFCVNQGNNNGWICIFNSGGSFLTNEDERWYLRGIVSTVTSNLKECKNETISLTNVDKFYETLKSPYTLNVFN